MHTTDTNRAAEQRGQHIAFERVAAAIERGTPWIRFLIPPILVFLACGVIAAAIIGQAIWGRLSPIAVAEMIVFALLMALLFLPAILLFLFWLALTAIRELPGKLRTFPDSMVQHRATLGEIARETRDRPASPVGWLRNLGRMAKLVYSAREDLVLYAPLLELLNPVLLLGTLLSFPAILVESMVAAIILLS